MSRTATGTVEWRGTPARWWARVTVLDETGKPRRPWVDLERPDLRNTPEDKKAAKAITRKRAKTAKAGTFVGAERATAPKVKLEDLEEKWFALLDGDADMKPATKSSHKSNWRSNIAPKLGSHEVMSLTTPALRAWIRELRETMKPSTVRNNAYSLLRFFADAKAERWITLTSNPMKDEEVTAMLPSVAAPEPDEIEHWTREQFEALLASKLPHDWFGIYLVDVLTGLRDGELRGLQFQHAALDAEIPHLRIRQQLGTRREGEEPQLGLPKSRWGRRDLPLHCAAHAWLAWWKSEGWKAFVGRKPKDDDFIFPNAAGEACRPASARILRGHLEAAGLPTHFVTPDGAREPFTLHAIRHTFASWLQGREGDLVDRLLGQAAKTVRGRHYQAPDLKQLAACVSSIELSWPERPGLLEVPSSSAVESSPESSRRPKDGAAKEENQQQIPTHRRFSSVVEQRFRKP